MYQELQQKLGFERLMAVQPNAGESSSSTTPASFSRPWLPTMKCSNPYVGSWIRGAALVQRAPERMLWASNRPHPSVRPHVPDDAMLLELLLDWAPDERTRKRILVDNPVELYGF